MSTFTISQTPDSANIYIYPNSDSDVNLSVSEATDHWWLVDETWSSPDVTTYVYTKSVPSIYDKYTVNYPSEATSGDINYVNVVARAVSKEFQQDSSGTFRLIAEDNSTTSYSANKAPLGTSYDNYNKIWKLNPSSVGWKWSDLKNLKIGVSCSSPSVSQSNATFYLYPDGTVSNTLSKQPTGYSAYQCVNTDDKSSYLWATTGASGAAYLDVDAPPVNSVATVYNVTVYAWFKVASGIGNTCAVGIKLNGSNYSGYSGTEGTSWTLHSYQYDINPDSGNPWVLSDLDDIQIHLSLDGADTKYCYYTYLKVAYQTNASPEIQTTQSYAIVNYSPDETTVTLTMPDSLQVSHSRQVNRHTFYDGDYEVDDYGRSGKSLAISGLETSSVTSTMQNLKDICHYGAKVTVAGLPDSNLNTDYHIVDFSFQQQGGEVDIYRWNITLEED